jgi:hypothetical protein
MYKVTVFKSFLSPSIFNVFTRNQQRSQKIFKASQPMDLTAVRTKLLGFGMQLLDGIDPNPDNFVCAGIIHTRTQAVGCLLRLEPNKQAEVVCSAVLYAILPLHGAGLCRLDIFVCRMFPCRICILCTHNKVTAFCARITCLM